MGKFTGRKYPCPSCGVSHVLDPRTGLCPECTARSGAPAPTMDSYTGQASRTNTYPESTILHDLALGLCSEAGEVAGKLKKIDRDFGGLVTDADRRELAYELGDVLWYCSQLAAKVGYRLSEVADMNLEKLADRESRGKLAGSGDHR